MKILVCYFSNTGNTEKVAKAIKEGIIQFLESLILRIRMMLSDARLSSVVGTEEPIEFESWLADYVGASKADNGALAIVDLSLIPADVLHVIIAVISRVVFESTQRYRRMNNCELPTVLVLEEAHTFIQRGVLQEEDLPTPAQMCRRTFERIAREGRKFGASICLISQRPVNLSTTALSQCNTHIILRVTNPNDLDHIQMSSEGIDSRIAKSITGLKVGEAIVVGEAVNYPVFISVRDRKSTKREKGAPLHQQAKEFEENQEKKEQGAEAFI